MTHAAVTAETVRAVRFARYGPPSVLRVDRVPAPRAPRGDELLVRVAASSVNGSDLALRRGGFPVATVGRMPFVPGFDLAGEVVAVGPAVTGFAVGDPVMALMPHSGGAQAELVLVRQGRAGAAPASVPPEVAAALPLAGLTALQALHGRAGDALRPGARVLVNGASGGIGSFAVQLAVLAGAHVTGVASGPQLAFVRGLGAHEVIDYRGQDFTTSGERWDVVLDTPGLMSFATGRRALTDGGVFVGTRPIGPDAARRLVPPAVRRGPGRFTVVMTAARSHDLARLARLVDTGRLVPAVDSVLPLDDVAAAHARAEGPACGKVVVQVSGA